VGELGLSRLLRGHDHARALSPQLASFPHLVAVFGSRKAMPAGAEVLCGRAIGGEERLGVSGGFKPLHALVPLAGRLMRVLCPVIEVAMPPMLHAWQALERRRLLVPPALYSRYREYVRPDLRPALGHGGHHSSPRTSHPSATCRRVWAVDAGAHGHRVGRTCGTTSVSLPTSRCCHGRTGAPPHRGSRDRSGNTARRHDR
jgi:hypothetical protein